MTQCNFRVGQKVVCVDDLTNFECGKLAELHRGRVYTVRKVGLQDVAGDLKPAVWLEEARRDSDWIIFPGHELQIVDFGFRASRFRPVVERKTDISIFKALLTPSKEKVETAS